MNEGVKILLERMKTNPEEFVPEYDGGVTKWGSVIGHYRTYLEAEDNKALEDAWRRTVAVAMQEKFTAAVMKELLAPEEDDDMGKWFSAQKIGTPRGGATLGAYSNTAHATIQLQAAQNAHLRTHLDRHRELLEMEKTVEVVRKPTTKKPHKTLFGKLFNYS